MSSPYDLPTRWFEDCAGVSTIDLKEHLELAVRTARYLERARIREWAQRKLELAEGNKQVIQGMISDQSAHANFWDGVANAVADLLNFLKESERNEEEEGRS